MVKKYIFMIVLIIPLLSACAQQKKEKNSESGVISKDITVAEFKTMYDPDKHILLDVRTEGEWNEGHLENAIRIDYKEDNFSDEIAKLDKEKSYYVYCKSGGRSGRTIKMMEESGFKESYNILGGIIDLEKENVKIIKN